MSNVLTKYKEDVTDVFGLGVEVLNVARSLKNISMDIKLLAYNGIVQAARIGSDQGKSLITLSGFLSDLPSQIAPELEDMEDLTRTLSTRITVASILVRRFMLYTIGLDNTLKLLTKENQRLGLSPHLNLLDIKDLQEIISNKYPDAVSREHQINIRRLAKRNMDLMNELNEKLSAAQAIIVHSRKKIERIRRSGFIANYMGSNISIESSYLSGNHSSFIGLVSNIKNMVDMLNERLDIMLDKINKGEKVLSNLIKTRIVK
ncbi:MAG: hypothetical protein ACLFQX_03480 [Candidatus Kapaibacterium sp.]